LGVSSRRAEKVHSATEFGRGALGLWTLPRAHEFLQGQLRGDTSARLAHGQRTVHALPPVQPKYHREAMPQPHLESNKQVAIRLDL
jgi:hypothetical protein